jgi:hypothetical protein
MKNKIIWLLLAFYLLIGVRLATATPLLSLTTKTNYFLIVGDSYFVDDTGGTQPPSVGYKTPDLLHGFLQSQHPTNQIRLWNLSRSGGNYGDYAIMLAQGGLPFSGYRSNLDDHFVFIKATENGGNNSNQVFLNYSNYCLAPALMTNGTTFGAVGGYAATATWKIYGMSDFPSLGASGNPLLSTHGIQSSGATNATLRYGAGAVDILFPSWTAATNDNVQRQGTNFWVTTGSKAGHIWSGGHWVGFIHAAQQMVYDPATGLYDTNISSAVIDFNAGSVYSTSHCSVFNVVRIGNTLTFTRLDDRTTFAWDVRNPTTGITNDESSGYTLIDPSLRNAFNYGLQVQNLPSGNYILIIGGQTVGTFSDVQLSTGDIGNGLNLFTNQNTPQWAQAVDGLRRIRVWEYVDPVTLIPGSAGDNQGAVSYGSTAFGRWQAGDRGDALIASMTAKGDQSTTNFASIQTQFTPTNLVWQLQYLGQTTHARARIAK